MPSGMEADSMTVRGPLSILGGLLRSWAEHWVSLDLKNKTLSFWYMGEALGAPRWAIDIASIVTAMYVPPSTGGTSEPENVFVVVTPQRTTHFLAPSARHMRIWLSAINAISTVGPSPLPPDGTELASITSSLDRKLAAGLISQSEYEHMIAIHLMSESETR